ncbi:hypothetical protein HOL63_01095 [Candidatus Peregrinibacteria bacterium]|jgi:hypothetical protein|nr:hypothetical protein [Candidatus Peregrinibacteria bacterium]MBT5468327.1 hypothetical protein [Candidatus Peregrinibacteria bacterium]MBT7337223.1 hypothetical protein [Candidatus Peregrinibacteria bacterium]
MGMVTHADGSDVQTPEYLSRQVRLMGKNSEQLLATGPERAMLSGQDWKNLDVVSHLGLDNIDAYRAICKNDIISYLMTQWISKYSSIFGVLARVEGQPVEQVEVEVGAFQCQINEMIGELRYLWGVHTGQSLALQAALEQIRWKAPEIRALVNQGQSVTNEQYLCADALFPHVVDSDEGSTDLLFDSDHISISTLRVSINDELAVAIKKELAGYL